MAQAIKLYPNLLLNFNKNVLYMLIYAFCINSLRSINTECL